MAADALTGSRIRERRQIVGLKQADLARKIGISASYLNLIEHNRRRIGGKLLLQIAEALGVESASLSEGAEATLLGALRAADADTDASHAELDRIEEFAGRFPGWAALLADTHARVARLEQTVEGLNDRLANDPTLAASVHEVLSTAASIRSTASILVETDALEPEWLDRFHANINEDSARLADSSRALAGYLEAGQENQSDTQSPQDEVDAYLSQRSYFVEELENDNSTVEQVAKAAQLSPSAEPILQSFLKLYQSDAQILPIQRLQDHVSEAPLDPLALASHLNVSPGLVMRRLASVPDLDAGYLMSDKAGSLLVRKTLPGLSLPRFGAACPLWPLFHAFSDPLSVSDVTITQSGRREAKFRCFATAEIRTGAQYNVTPNLTAGMLILPSTDAGEVDMSVGTTCRLCPQANCASRREPSVLSD